MIIFLDPRDKLCTPQEIDSVLSAEFPDLDEEPELFQSVSKFMVHTPCGLANPKAPCMINGKFSVKALKYIYKYVYKGHDHSTMEFGTCQDEIKLYLDSIYISAHEGIWRLFQFLMHEEFQNIVRLQIYLPNQQTVVWNENTTVDLQIIVDEQRNKDTTLTKYFKANIKYLEARDLLYHNFSSKFVWDVRKRQWTKRQRGFAIARMHYVHPNSGECFYHCTLLCYVKGATSFEDLHTVNGVLYPTFCAACLAHGLLEDDNEWRICL